MNEVKPATNIEQLRNILKGEDKSIPTTTALSMLLLSDYPYKERELETLLLNSKESDGIKHLAATSLGKIDSSKAREILIKSTKVVKGAAGQRSNCDVKIWK
jgi:hypothetical protein